MGDTGPQEVLHLLDDAIENSAIGVKIRIFALAQNEPLRKQDFHQALKVTTVILRQVDPERIKIAEFRFGQPP